MAFVTIIGSIIYSTKLEQQVNIAIKSSPQPNNFTSENGIIPHTTIYHKIFKKFLFFVKICGTKKHHDYTLSWLKSFFSQLSTMIFLSNFLEASNLGCAYSMWVFVGVIVATLLWPSVGVKPNTWKKRGFGVLRDSRMFRARQHDPKHLALGWSWCHWKGLEA